MRLLHTFGLVVGLNVVVLPGCERCERGIEQTSAQGLVEELSKVGDSGSGLVVVRLTGRDSVVLVGSPYLYAREWEELCPDLRESEAEDLELYSAGLESWMVVVVHDGCVQSLVHIDNRFASKPGMFRVKDGDGIAVLDTGEEYRPLQMVLVENAEVIEGMFSAD